MTLRELDDHLKEYLRIGEYAAADSAINGIQIETGRDVKKVAVAVDAALETAERATALGADLLLVHHGLFWGNEQPLIGARYCRFRHFLINDLGLYAVHLPLDAHEEVGNNASMARTLGLGSLRPFGEYHGKLIGWAGVLPAPLSTAEVALSLFGTTDDLLGLLPFGPQENRTVGIVSGGASRQALQAIVEGLDLFITGEPSHTIYHDCLEAGINGMFGGHYRTEAFGVRALAAHLERQFGLETVFIDVPTGL